MLGARKVLIRVAYTSPVVRKSAGYHIGCLRPLHFSRLRSTAASMANISTPIPSLKLHDGHSIPMVSNFSKIAH